MAQANDMPPVETDYATPNGLHFKISVTNGFGRWRCTECGKDGFTAHESGDDTDRQTKLQAREHSVLCPAGRGSKPQS
jgi:hypothetical protein